MKIKKGICFGLSIVAIVLLLGGCTKAEKSASDSYFAAPSLASSASSDIDESAQIFNKDIVQLIGSENRLVAKYIGDGCYARTTGMGTTELSYYQPFISFTFSPDAAVSYFKEGFSEGANEQNPLDDSLKVMWIDFMCDYDAAANKVTSQDSLKRLINTEQDITYNFLCDALAQAPEFVHVENIYYLSPSPDSYNRQGAQIDGGVYTAMFTAENTQLSVSFIKSEDEYVALFAKLNA